MSTNKDLKTSKIQLFIKLIGYFDEVISDYNKTGHIKTEVYNESVQNVELADKLIKNLYNEAKIYTYSESLTILQLSYALILCYKESLKKMKYEAVNNIDSEVIKHIQQLIINEDK